MSARRRSPRDGPARGRAARVCCALALAASLVSAAGAGRGNAAGEYDLKSAFLVNFARLVEWPGGSFESPESAFVIGVLADEQTAAIVEDRASGALVDRHPVRVVRLAGAEGVGDCHLVFVAQSSREHSAAVLAAAREAGPVLTVGESEGFAGDGGVIRFFMQERKIRFEINRGAAGRAGFRISSRLLKLARIVPDAGLAVQ